MKRRSVVASILLTAAFVLSACGGNQAATPPEGTVSRPIDKATQGTTAAGQPLKVVTTMSVLADMIKNVGGERVVVENIIPIGAGPEDYQPTPQDVQTIANADIVFFNGHGLEAWLGDLFTSAAKANQPQIAVSDGLQAIDVGSEEFKEGNPHFWMSAAYGVRYVEKIRDGLIGVDAAGKDAYTTQAARYIAQLTTLNDELKQLANTLPAEQRKMVTNHDAFPYFAQEYGFTIVGNILGNPEAEPSAGDLATLVTNIKAQHVKAVFSESQFNPKLAQTISQEANITIVADLYTDTLGEAGSGGASYIDMLRYDMKTVVDALK